MGKLINLIIFFVIGWLVYTQFFGTTEEQEKGKTVINSGKETVKGIIGIFQHESGKIKEGTYDESIDKLGTLLDNLRKETKDNGQKDQLEVFVKEKQRIQKEVAKSKAEGGLDDASEEKTKEDLKKLTENIGKLVDAM